MESGKWKLCESSVRRTDACWGHSLFLTLSSILPSCMLTLIFMTVSCHFFLQQFIKTSTDLPQPNIYGIHLLCSLLFKRHSIYSASFWLLWQAFQIFFFCYTSCLAISLHQHGLDFTGFHPEASIMTRVQVFQDLSDLSALMKPNNGRQDNRY